MRRLILPALGFLVGGAASFALFVSLLDSPSRMVSVRELDGIAVKDGRLELIFALTPAVRNCPAVVDRQMWRWETFDGKRMRYIVPLQSIGTPITPTDEGSVILAIQTPPGLTAGQWYYSSRTTFNCSWLGKLSGVSQTRSPDVPVQITN